MTTVAADIGERWTGWEDEDALSYQLRLTLRGALDTPDAAQAWDQLSALGAWDFGVPLDLGGLELGHAPLGMLCEEVGAAALPVPLLGTLVTLGLLSSTGSHPELLDDIRAGRLAVAMAGRLPGPAGIPQTALDWHSLPDGQPLAGVRPLSGGGDLSGGGALVGGAGGPAGAGLPPAESAGLLAGTAGPFATGVTPGGVLLVTDGSDGPRLCLLTLPHPGVELRHIAERGGGPTAAAVLHQAAVRADSVLMSGPTAAKSLAHIGVAVGVYQAALLCGLTAAALTAATRRLRARHQFGKALLQHQVPRLRVAALLARLDVTRLVVAEAARSLDRGQVSAARAAGVLALAAETALDTTRDALHLHGAAGLARDTVVAACYRRVAWEALRCGPVSALWTTAAGAAAEEVHP